MSENRVSSKLEAEAYEQLRKGGWSEDEIIQNPPPISQDLHFIPDLVLVNQAFPLAVVEVKARRAVQADIFAQAMDYAQRLRLPFVLLGNDTGWVCTRVADTIEVKTGPLPTPAELWALLESPVEPGDPRRVAPISNIPGWPLRLPQFLAISRIIDAVTEGKKHIQVALPFQSGKSQVILQVVGKLFRSRLFSRALLLSARRDMINQLEMRFSPLRDLIQSNRGQLGLETDGLTFSTISAVTSAIAGANPVLSLDHYDLVLIDDIRANPSLEKIFSQFPKATIIGLASAFTKDENLLKLFGPPVFSYTLQQALADASVQPPKGYASVNLGSIADIAAGVVRTSARSSLPLSQEELAVNEVLFLVTGTDIAEDGSVSASSYTTTESLGLSQVNERYLLQAGDILASSWLLGGVKGKIGLVTDVLPHPTIFTNRLLRIRVDPRMAKAEDVFAFLRSDNGQIALRQFVNRTRISITDLASIVIFLPDLSTASARADSKAASNLEAAEIPASEKGGDDSPVEELSAASYAIRQINDSILPALASLEADHSVGIIDPLSIHQIGEQLGAISESLRPVPLSDLVTMQFPTPIALAYRRFHESRFNIYEQVMRLRDLFEATSYFLYHMVLADWLHRLDPTNFRVADASARRAYNQSSMAYRIGFVKAILCAAQVHGQDQLFVPQLLNTSVVQLGQRLQRDFRNVLSHTATPTERHQRKILEEFQPEVERMLSEVTFLTQYRLARVPSFFFEDGERKAQLEVYRGTAPYLQNEVFDTDVDRNHLVLLDEENRALDLHPFYQLVDTSYTINATNETRYETHLCFLKSRAAGSPPGQSGELRGESVPGNYEILLNGYDLFDTLLIRVGS